MSSERKIKSESERDWKLYARYVKDSRINFVAYRRPRIYIYICTYTLIYIHTCARLFAFSARVRARVNDLDKGRDCVRARVVGVE